MKHLSHHVWISHGVRERSLEIPSPISHANACRMFMHALDSSTLTYERGTVGVGDNARQE